MFTTIELDKNLYIIVKKDSLTENGLEAPVQAHGFIRIDTYEDY